MNKRFLFYLVVFFSFLVVMQSEKTHSVTAVSSQSHLEDRTTLFLPILNNHYDSRFPAPLFGMQMYSSTATTSKYYPFLIGSGTSWVRVPIDWQHIEPEKLSPAIYSWSRTDQIVAASRPDMGGLHMIGVIDILPAWAQLIPGAVSGPIRPDALDDFAEFVKATVERYDGDGHEDAPGSPVIKHWEIINEPDGGNPMRWGEYGEEYAEMLAIAYTAIKTADPGALVLFGGIAYDWFDYQGGPFVSSFLDDVLAAGGGNYFDVMNFHMYPSFAPNWNSLSTGLKGKAEAIRVKLAEYGFEKPIVITEAGWHNSTDTEPISSDEKQATRLVQLVTQSYAVGAKVMIWFMLSDPGGFLPNFGLVTNEDPPMPKEAYTAYQNAVSILSSARFVQDLSQVDSALGKETIELYQFRTPNGPLYVGWVNPYSSAETRYVQISASSVTLIDPWGEVITSIANNMDNEIMSIPITNQPIYIQVNTP